MANQSFYKDIFAIEQETHDINIVRKKAELIAELKQKIDENRKAFKDILGMEIKDIVSKEDVS